MINNFQQILPHLSFDEGEFYFVLLIQRKKDQDVPANHQSARTIKTYIITSKEQLLEKEQEIIGLCEYFNARAGISTNKFSHKKLAIPFIQKALELYKNGHYEFTYLFDKVVGEAKETVVEKRWLIDLDDKINLSKIQEILTSCKPNKNEIDVFETTNGYHLLTNPFNSEEFMKEVTKLKIDATIHKTNYIALYYPSKQ